MIKCGKQKEKHTAKKYPIKKEINVERRWRKKTGSCNFLGFNDKHDTQAFAITIKPIKDERQPAKSQNDKNPTTNRKTISGDDWTAKGALAKKMARNKHGTQAIEVNGQTKRKSFDKSFVFLTHFYHFSLWPLFASSHCACPLCWFCY